MQYLKIEGGKVTKTINNIRREYSTTSFPNGVPEAKWLEEQKLVAVTEPQLASHRDKVEDVDAYEKDGKWYTKKVTPYVDDTPAPTTEEKWANIRQQRFEKLRMTDWTRFDDVTITNSKKTEYETYRQALRDITKQSDPDKITWPTEPS